MYEDVLGQANTDGSLLLMYSSVRSARKKTSKFEIILAGTTCVLVLVLENTNMPGNDDPTGTSSASTTTVLYLVLVPHLPYNHNTVKNARTQARTPLVT
jgi:hypothetical protein